MTQTNTIDIPALSAHISEFLDLNKAVDIVAIPLEGKSNIADYMIVCSGTSQRHIQAMAEKLKEEFHKAGIKEIKIEGKGGSDWVLLDAGDIIVHLFKPEIRDMYSLEKMWGVDFKPSEIA